MEPRVHVAGQPFAPWFDTAALPAVLGKVFQKRADGLVATDPGILSVGDRLGIFLPRCHAEADGARARFEAAGHVLRVLSRYRRERDSQRSVVRHDMELALSESGSVDDLFGRLEAALLLWDDFRRVGPLPVASRQSGPRVRGRIHWPRTIARTDATLSGDNVVYAVPIYTRFAIDPEQPLTVLHEETCREAGAWLGFLGSAGGAPLSPRNALSVLDRHERQLFQDRQRRACTWMRQYHTHHRTDRSGTARGVAGVFATDFSRVWERMLCVALGPTRSARLPEGRYRHTGGGQSHGTSFRLDALLETRWAGQPALVVVDAKDYALGALPQHHDINKQLLYRLLLSEAAVEGGLPLSRIGSAFVLPRVVPQGVMAMATHELTQDDGEVLELGRIAVLAADFDRVAAAYARGRSDEGMRVLVVEEASTGSGVA